MFRITFYRGGVVAVVTNGAPVEMCSPSFAQQQEQSVGQHVGVARVDVIADGEVTASLDRDPDVRCAVEVFWPGRWRLLPRRLAVRESADVLHRYVSQEG